MSRFREWNEQTRPDALGEALFAGELIVFRRLEPIVALGGRVRGLLEDAFGTDAPQTAEGAMTAVRFREASVQARRLVDNDPVVAECWSAALREIGYDPEEVYGDRMRLRVVPSREAARGRRTRPLAPHRDSWGANIPAQINWWLPLYPLAAERTMVIWPDLFDRPVRNTSGEWDFDTLASGRIQGYPLLPVAEEEPEIEPAAVTIEPGDLLAFSAAHLHASRSDDSGVSRLSLDTRTIWAGDVRSGRGAPDVDGAPKRPRWEWFVRQSDGRNANEVFGTTSNGSSVAA